MESTSQSLAGRSAVVHLLPLSRDEAAGFPQHPKTLNETLLTGGYPRILDRKLRPADWLAAYVATYLERDVRSISNVGDLTAFQLDTLFLAMPISWRGTLQQYVGRLHRLPVVVKAAALGGDFLSWPQTSFTVPQ